MPKLQSAQDIFDKVLLVVVMLIMLGVLVCSFAKQDPKGDGKNSDWMRTEAATVVGALLLKITSDRKQTDKPADPALPPTVGDAANAK